MTPQQALAFLGQTFNDHLAGLSPAARLAMTAMGQQALNAIAPHLPQDPPVVPQGAPTVALPPDDAPGAAENKPVARHSTKRGKR